MPQPAPIDWPSDATCDALVGRWRLWQRRGGHRTSTDDLLTAWFAVRQWRQRFQVPGRAAQRSERGRLGDSVDAEKLVARLPDPPARYADLGCGIGSVMLMTAHALRPGEVRGFEAQAQSVAMARRSAAELPDALDVEVVIADLRELDAADVGRFDLITASPPYLRVGTGVMSPDPQRRACRFELRGGIEAYCDAAARLLTPEGRFVVVFQTEWDPRVLAAAEAAGLELSARADIRTRVGDVRPFLSLYALGRGAAATGALVHVGPAVSFATRDLDGQITAEYRAARRELGFER